MSPQPLAEILDRVATGDCLKVLPFVPDGSIDMVLCDLPYGTTRNAWDSVIDLDKLWVQYLRVIKPNGAILLFGQAPFTYALHASMPRLFRYEWIWEKAQATGYLNARRAPMKAHENVLAFYRKQPTYNPQMTDGHPRKVSTAHHKRDTRKTTNYGEHEHRDYDSTQRYPRSVLYYPTDHQRSTIHATQKPVALCEYLIRTYTNKGEVVLDNALGSGTTAVAALRTGRHFIGIEKEAEMAQKAIERIRGES